MFHSSPLCLAAAIALAAQAVTPGRTPAQSGESQCHILCAPRFSVRPSVHRSEIANSPRVRNLETGEVTRLESKDNLMLFFLTTVPTEWERIALYADMSWLPNASAQTNPFTRYTASALGEDIRANLPALGAGVSATLVTASSTNDVIAVSAYAGDLFSKAAQPDATSDYTHKLDVGGTATLGALAWLPEDNWLRNLRLVGTLDWVVTGLPRSGDELPKGEQVYLDDVLGLSFALGVSVPVAPLR